MVESVTSIVLVCSAILNRFRWTDRFLSLPGMKYQYEEYNDTYEIIDFSKEFYNNFLNEITYTEYFSVIISILSLVISNIGYIQLTKFDESDNEIIKKKEKKEKNLNKILLPLCLFLIFVSRFYLISLDVSFGVFTVVFLIIIPILVLILICPQMYNTQEYAKAFMNWFLIVVSIFISYKIDGIIIYGYN